MRAKMIAIKVKVERILAVGGVRDELRKLEKYYEV